MIRIEQEQTCKFLFLLAVFLLSTIPANINNVKAQEDSWTSLSPMPAARYGLGVTAVNGKIYAIGGFNGGYLATNEMYTINISLFLQ